MTWTTGVLYEGDGSHKNHKCDICDEKPFIVMVAPHGRYFLCKEHWLDRDEREYQYHRDLQKQGRIE